MKEKRPDLRVFTWIRPYLARWGMYRVLVVDDEKLEREGIRFLLSMEEGEWEIYEAANGKLALNELRKHPVDLMLTDIKMPHMDGLELSKKQGRNIRIWKLSFSAVMEILLLPRRRSVMV